MNEATKEMQKGIDATIAEHGQPVRKSSIGLGMIDLCYTTFTATVWDTGKVTYNAPQI